MAIVGLDIDDVLLGFQASFIAWHNSHYDTLLRYEDFKSFDYTKVIGVAREECYARVMKFYNSPDFDNLLPLRSSPIYVPALANRHTLLAITSRHDDLIPRTHASLDKYFPHCFSGVHFTNHWFGNGRRTKSEVCKENGVQILVDDHCTFAEEAADNGIRVIMPDRPWNQDFKNHGVIRVGREWHYIYSAVENLAQKIDGVQPRYFLP